MTKRVIAYIGLGSNLDGPIQQVQQAIEELGELPETESLAHSSLYLTAPFGPPGQDDYINAVVKLHTALTPNVLLEQLLLIEQRHLRVRRVHWGPRTLDCDLLLYGDQVVDEPHLQVPHPHMTERPNVLIPLLEIEPNCCLPSGRRLADFAAHCADEGVRLLAEELL